MACDFGTNLFVLQFSLEPDTSYIVGIYTSEANAKTAAETIIGVEATWLPKRTGALHLSGYTEASNDANLAYKRGVSIAIEQHILSDVP